MTEYALILLSTILVNNFVLVKFLGLCPFMGVSRKLETAMGMALATTFVLTLSSLLYNVLGIFLPLITTNCAVLGVALLNVLEKNNFIESLFYGFGAAVGFSLVLILFAAMRERIAAADVPEVFQGTSIALITAGIMSLAFMGFAGLIKV